MSTLPRAESRRAYSWWWDSHISPKNSKWLQENLRDMDVKVKSMIKLIEEDADSFARRAEMYYKKRPELMKLVEEFYRAYRALAERYDQATGALRHAHRTMSEAFPNHIPLALPDESLSNNALEMVSPRCTTLDSDDLPEEAFGFPAPFNAFDRKETYPEENEALATKKGLRHYNKMFIPRVKLPDENEEDGMSRARLPEGKVRKSLNFQEEEENAPNTKVYINSRNHVQSGKEKENIKYGIKNLQEQVSQLSNENQSLKASIELESKHLDFSKSEVQSLRDLVSKLESEKDVALRQNQLSAETNSSYEIQISQLKDEIRKLNEEMEMAAMKLSTAEERCLALEKANHSVVLELEEAKCDLEQLRISLKESCEKHEKAEMSLKSSEHLYNQSNEKVILMTLEIKSLVERLEVIENCKVSLEEEVSKLKDMNSTINEHNLACASKVRNLEDVIISLKELNYKLEDEVGIHAQSKKVLQQELDSVKNDRNELDLKHQTLTKQLEEACLHIESLETLLKELQSSHVELIESYRKLEGEKLLIFNKLNDMGSVSEKNSALENSLFVANAELENLRGKMKLLEGLCESLNSAVSTHITEKFVLASQIKTLAENVEKLSVRSILFENSLDDANTELEVLLLKMRDLEESCRSLSNANLDLHSQNNDLISQVEKIQKMLSNLETTHASSEEKLLYVVKEKDLYIKKIQQLEFSLSTLQKDHENQLCVLQVNRQLREELEAVHQECFSHMIEIFIIQNCLSDMSDFCIFEKQKCMSLVESNEIKLAALESQIHFLQGEIKVRDDNIDEKEQNSMNFLLEVFFLQRCLSEMKAQNFTISQEYQRLLEASRSSEELVKELAESDLARKNKIGYLMDHILKVRNGIHCLLKQLNISHELMDIDGGEAAILLPTILGEINNLKASVSNFLDESELLRAEISVYLTLLKETGLEKILLGQEIEEVNRQSLVLKAELDSLTRSLEDSLDGLHNSREENDTLKVENKLISIEAMTNEHLHLFFSSLNDERIQQLKLLNGDICSLLAIHNGLVEEIRGSNERVRSVENENKQLRKSLASLEELRTQMTILEFDVFTASSLCEELMLQVEDQDNFMMTKSKELSNVNDMLQSKQGEIDTAKMVRLELEKEITYLLEGTAIKDKQIASINEGNKTLNDELNRFRVSFEALKLREKRLSYELSKEKAEAEWCEGEMMELLYEVQSSVLNAAVYDEKMFELASRCEDLEISAMIHNETLREVIALKHSNEVELKMKLDDFEKENGMLRTNLKALLPLMISLGAGISSVEEHVCQLSKDRGPQDNPSCDYVNHDTSNINHDQPTMEGVFEMQNLIAKVESLQKLVTDTIIHLDQEKLRSATNMESAIREIEELKLKQSSIKEHKQGMESSSSSMVKDIELDQVSNSCRVSRFHSAESNDQMLKLWESPDRNFDNQISTDHDIETSEEAKREKPSSELVPNKDIGVYKHVSDREIKESQDDWNRMVLKSLAIHADKLFALQTNAQELKLKMERSSTSVQHNKLQFDTLKANLRDAEKGTSDLLDRIGKLKMLVELYANSFNDEEMGFTQRKQVLEQMRSGSDRIGMLELELQKIDYIFLKLEEECESYATRGGDRTPRMLLRDYLYGKKDRKGKKRDRFCGCVKPRTNDDY